MQKRRPSLILSLLQLFAGSGGRSPRVVKSRAKPQRIKITMLPPEEIVTREGEPLVGDPVGSPRIPIPRKKGRTKEQQAADWLKYCGEVRTQFKQSAERNRRNALLVGSKQYIWRSSGDGDVCPECAKKDGKRFSWKRPPPGGHPGETTCCSGEWCRCIAEAIIPEAF